MRDSKKCPHCSAKMEYLSYRCNYREYGREWGRCSLNGDDPEMDDREGRDYESDEWEYYCPVCGDGVDRRNLEDYMNIPEKINTSDDVTVDSFNQNQLKRV